MKKVIMSLLMIGNVFATDIKYSQEVDAIGITGSTLPNFPNYVIRIKSGELKDCLIFTSLKLESHNTRAVSKSAKISCNKEKNMKNIKITLLDSKDGQRGLLIDKVRTTNPLNSLSVGISYGIQRDKKMSVIIWKENSKIKNKSSSKELENRLFLNK